MWCGDLSLLLDEIPSPFFHHPDRQTRFHWWRKLGAVWVMMMPLHPLHLHQGNRLFRGKNCSSSVKIKDSSAKFTYHCGATHVNKFHLFQSLLGLPLRRKQRVQADIVKGKTKPRKIALLLLSFPFLRVQTARTWPDGRTACVYWQGQFRGLLLVLCVFTDVCVCVRTTSSLSSLISIHRSISLYSSSKDEIAGTNIHPETTRHFWYRLEDVFYVHLVITVPPGLTTHYLERHNSRTVWNWPTCHAPFSDQGRQGWVTNRGLIVRYK